MPARPSSHCAEAAVPTRARRAARSTATCSPSSVRRPQSGSAYQVGHRVRASGALHGNREAGEIVRVAQEDPSVGEIQDDEHAGRPYRAPSPTSRRRR